jgi:hypothetical protein
MSCWLWLLALLLVGLRSPAAAQNGSASWTQGLAGDHFAAYTPVWRSGLILGTSLLLMPGVGWIWRKGGRYADAGRPDWPFNTPADRAVAGAGRPLWSLVPRTPAGWGVAENPAPLVVWNSMQWARPVDMTVVGLARVSNRFAVLGAGVRYWTDTPTERVRHWGFRFTVNFQF